MHFKFILIFSAFFVPFNLVTAQERYKGFGIEGQSSLYSSFVKSKDFPIGFQFVSSWGASINYYQTKMSYSVFLNKHQSFYSVANGLLLYRDYNGYECGINFRRIFSELKTPHLYWGGGLMISGNYDQYALIEQYMVYPTIGFESFLLFHLLHKKIPFTISIPFSYSFRESGHYSNAGLSFRIGLCFP